MSLDHERVKAGEETTKALQKTPQELIEDIHVEIAQWDDNRSSFRVQFAFASLLSVLAVQSEKLTKKNLDLQSKVVNLTWALFWLTFILTIVAGIQLFLIFADGH